MTSFLENIFQLTEWSRPTFQEIHEQEILERLCDPSVPLMAWEDTARSFLKAEGIFIYNFEGDLDVTFKNSANLLLDYAKKLSNLDISALTLNPASCGYLLCELERFAGIVNHITKLRNNLACLAVVNVHRKARTIRNISEYVQKNSQQVAALQVSNLIRRTDEVDQSLVLFREARHDIYDFKPAGIEALLHDLIYETAHRCAILPSRLHMHEVDTMPKAHVNGGGFADIYKGTLSDGRVVALKVPRCFGKPDEIKKVHAEISKEGVVWHFSKHINVLPLLGISLTKFQDEKPNLLVLVTPWMANGTLKEFLRCKPNTDRGKMIEDVASGVFYLHVSRVPPVVHGDLRCDNILVDENGVPKIADFGLSRVKDIQASLTGTSSAGAKGSLRWQAPELVFPDRFRGTGKHTFASDIYALGMTCLEIVTDEVPYSGLSDAQVIAAVLHGDLPKVLANAAYLRDYEIQWELVKRCWSRKVDDRPSAYDLWDSESSFM